MADQSSPLGAKLNLKQMKKYGLLEKLMGFLLRLSHLALKRCCRYETAHINKLVFIEMK